jgi:hypothetical protein
MDGRGYADSMGCQPWSFPVAIEELRAAGCTNNDLKFLVVCGYAEIAVETTARGRRRYSKRKEVPLQGKTWFVLTNSGLRVANELGAESSARVASEEEGKRQSTLCPQFVSRVLSVGNRVIKRFRQPADNQEVILLAFEELGWVSEIDDPLPRVPEIEPKERLRQTIANLNRNQKSPIIHFYGNGTGQKIGWEWRA